RWECRHGAGQIVTRPTAVTSSSEPQAVAFSSCVREFDDDWLWRPANISEGRARTPHGEYDTWSRRRVSHANRGRRRVARGVPRSLRRDSGPAISTGGDGAWARAARGGSTGAAAPD